MTYADPSPLPPGCLEEGVVLPPGPLTLTRINADLLGSTGEPVTWTGTFKVLPETGEGGTCIVERAFTATR